MQLPPVPLPPAVFVGRETELDKLARALDRVRVAVVVGVAGIGKTAFALRFLARLADVGPVVFLRARVPALGTLIDDARRALSGGAVAELGSDAERLGDLGARLNRKRATLVVDDLHAVGAGAAVELTAGLASLLKQGRAIAMSRVRLERHAEHPDWLELELPGLEPAAARQLWAALDELYGPSGDFDELPPTVVPSPFLLRRAHTGALYDDDPIEMSVRALAQSERTMATVLALARQRPSVAALEAAIGRETKRALSSLVQKLIAEVDSGRAAAVSGSFRDALIACATLDERRAAHALLATIAASSPRDPVIAFRDEVFHLVEAGEHARACGRIHHGAAEMVRLGASGEVVRALELIPLASRSVEARIAHARALARLVEPRRARDELGLLAAEPARSDVAEPWRHEVRFSLATTSYMVGQVDEGLRQLEALLELPDLAPDLAFQIELQRAWALTTSGRGRDARDRLRQMETRHADGVQPALLAFYGAVSAWSDEDEEAMREQLPRALTLVPEEAPPFATGGLVPLSLAAMLARIARFEEADRFISLAEDGWARSDDPSSLLLLQRMRGLTALERGERLEALELLRPVATAYERSGSVVAQLGLQAVIGRLLLVLGRRAEGLALLDATEALARRSGAMQAAVAAVHARKLDPLARRGDAAPHPRRRSEHVRWHVCSALAAAEAGDAPRARRLLASLDTGGPGYGVDRAMATIATAALRRLEGELGQAVDLVERAALEAKADGADDDLVPELAQRVAGPVLVTGGSRSPSRAPLGPVRVDLVLDGRTHRLTTSGAEVDLAKRPTLRKLLYVLARKPGTIFSKQQLSNAIWPARYNPLTHDNALWVNVRRLRVLLSDTRLEIASDEQGYRLEAPADFVFVDPA